MDKNPKHPLNATADHNIEEQAVTGKHKKHIYD